MCGIAGIVDLAHERTADMPALERMAAAITHRGPDEEGFFVQPGLALASRRLSIVGLEDGQQPVFNETRTVVAVYNGELFDYPELQQRLIARGHKLRSHCDSELLVHLWEEYGEGMFDHLRGQFAFALADLERRVLILCRDRTGICPLYWSQQDDWLLFGSEIKALLASELIEAAPDLHGLDNVFTFFSMPGRRTAFRGINGVLPGHYLRVHFGRGTSPDISERCYWDFDFPDRGDEEDPSQKPELIDEFDAALDEAVRIRLRADVPVAAYLSGGVDSSVIVAKSRKLYGGKLSTFTARIGDSRLDESSVAARFAADMGCEHHTVRCDQQALSSVYPRIVAAADCPVVDTNAGSLYELSRAVREAGFKVALTGEGADEALAGYVWLKIHKAMRVVGWRGFQPIAWGLERLYHFEFPQAPRGEFRRINRVLGGLHAQTLVYHGTSTSRWWLLRDEVRDQIQDETAFDQLELPERLQRWHPLNQSLYVGYKTQLPGLLLNHRGDRTAMANSVETRYPFLDERFMQFCARIHPSWKLRGIRGDKHLLRQAATRFLPRKLALRPKAMFRAPFAGTLLTGNVPYVDQLLSRESLERTPYFAPERVAGLLDRFRRGAYFRPLRMFLEMGLCAVVGTQLWHHLYFGGGLCDLPTWQPTSPAESKNVNV
jgi:asparagine synthase (glutamine-hydrolysing)